MFTQNQVLRFILAFKIRHLRLDKNLSYQELSDKTELSTSYLSDIEKGKRYPKPDKIAKLADALNVEYDYLVSTSSSNKLRPIINLINSDFLKLFPLEEFGINMEKVLEILSQTPDRVNAFISTFFMIARNYQISNKEFYMEAMRSYQDMHNNDFPELEQAAKNFKEEYSIKDNRSLTSDFLEEQLEEIFDIKVNKTKLVKNKKLSKLRSYFDDEHNILYINSNLHEAQVNFLIAKELGFQYLKLKDRSYTSPIIDMDAFEKLLTSYKASHFASAIIMPPDKMAEDIGKIISLKNWSSDLLLDLLSKYNTTPETLFQRWTNLLPKYFGIEDLFFIKLTATQKLEKLSMSKNLHLSQVHTPYNNRLNEQFCRRWAAYKCLSETINSNNELIVSAQISEYWDSGNSYLCISIGQRISKTKLKSVTLGLLVNDKLRSNCYFLSELESKKHIVGTTCERCMVSDCTQRRAQPIHLKEDIIKKEIIAELLNLPNSAF